MNVSKPLGDALLRYDQESVIFCILTLGVMVDTNKRCFTRCAFRQQQQLQCSHHGSSPLCSIVSPLPDRLWHACYGFDVR